MRFRNQKSRLQICDAQQGFTLLELVVVLAILGFLTVMTAQIFTREDNQTRFDSTRATLEEIRTAILGRPGIYTNGQRQFGGYVADMGSLPIVNATTNFQPIHLWTADLDGDPVTPGALPTWTHNPAPNPPNTQVWMGWRGPYLDTPQQGDNILRDGWGNVLNFVVDAPSVGDLTISSSGENSILGDADDITQVIYRTEYQGPVAGRIVGVDASNASNFEVEMYFPVGGQEPTTPHIITGVTDDGYFRFEMDSTSTIGLNGSMDIPIGLRQIAISVGGTLGTERVFAVEPTGNWLGDFEL